MRIVDPSSPVLRQRIVSALMTCSRVHGQGQVQQGWFSFGVSFYVRIARCGPLFFSNLVRRCPERDTEKYLSARPLLQAKFPPQYSAPPITPSRSCSCSLAVADARRTLTFGVGIFPFCIPRMPEVLPISDVFRRGIALSTRTRDQRPKQPVNPNPFESRCRESP